MKFLEPLIEEQFCTTGYFLDDQQEKVKVVVRYYPYRMSFDTSTNAGIGYRPAEIAIKLLEQNLMERYNLKTCSRCGSIGYEKDVFTEDCIFCHGTTEKELLKKFSQRCGRKIRKYK